MDIAHLEELRSLLCCAGCGSALTKEGTEVFSAPQEWWEVRMTCAQCETRLEFPLRILGDSSDMPLCPRDLCPADNQNSHSARLGEHLWVVARGSACLEQFVLLVIPREAINGNDLLDAHEQLWGLPSTLSALLHIGQSR